MSEFAYRPAACVPFQDTEAIARCRRIARAEIEQHPNPDFRIRVVPDEHLMFLWQADMYRRLKETREAGRSCVMLLPNPYPGYKHLARLINATRLDCSHAWFFAMDEYADETGRAAPSDWEHGFVHAMRKFLWQEIDADLRPPLEQVLGPRHDNAAHYFEMMEEAGGIDISYTGPGWTGHIAFVEPDAPEFAPQSDDPDRALDEWQQMGTRVVTLSPFTIAQNSLHGSFGNSGDLTRVPPRAITVGPKEIIAARHRWEMAAITVGGSAHSWQRLTARLCYHGPVTPKLPASLFQTLRTDCYLTETLAADIEDTWEKGY